MRGYSLRVRIAYALFALVAVPAFIILFSIAVTGVVGKSNYAVYTIYAAVLIAVVFAFILSFFVLNHIFRPIKRLLEKVKIIDPERPVSFERTHIKEIDSLACAFEVLSGKISKAASKMFTIIELVDMPLGSFETNRARGTALLSRSLFKIFNLDVPDDSFFSMPIERWDELIASMEEYDSVTDSDGITQTLYYATDKNESKRWFRARKISEATGDIGVLIDVTDEIMQKQRLEFERNYDSLTKLLNRKGFADKALEYLSEYKDKVAILMLADLDDLKFINDTYGHDEGDNYIRAFAWFLNKFSEIGGVAGRISGDEFVVLLCGFDTREQARKAFDSVFNGCKDEFITLRNGEQYKLGVSVGLSYYPCDSADVNMLVKYADYAMYETKRENKGEVREFNISVYNTNSFVINMKNVLELLIKEKRLRFLFQPIIDVKTGGVYAYEALMRPMVRELKTAGDVLRIARSQSKLYEIEKLTFDIVLGWLAEQKESTGDFKIFLNVIQGQNFTEEDFNEIQVKYSYLFDRMVFEITEEDFRDFDEMTERIKKYREQGALFAIDNYGAGYSNPKTFQSVAPEFIKLDISIVRNIHQNEDKRQLTQNIMSYAAGRNIKVIAEGVENQYELKTLVDFGVDYVQGAFLGIPEVEIKDISEKARKYVLEASGSQGRE